MAGSDALSGAASGAATGAAFGPWGAVIGGAVGLAGGLLSKKKAPTVAPYIPVNAQNEQKNAIQGNIAAEDDIETLLSRSNRYTQNEANDLMEMAIPGYSKLRGTLLSQAQKRAENPYDVPQEVTDNLTRIASERGISRGTRGQTNQFSLLRDLGVNQLNYGNNNLSSALGALTSLSGIAPRVSPASPLSFYISPGQQIQNATQNSQGAQTTAQGGYNATAAADNYNSQNMWDSILKGVGTFAGASKAGFGGTGSAAKPAPASTPGYV